MYLQRGDFLTRRSADQARPHIEALEILPQAIQQAMDAQVMKPGDAQQVSDALWALLHGLVALAIELPVFDEDRISHMASAVHELWMHGLL
jgi:hypothetical protein